MRFSRRVPVPAPRSDVHRSSILTLAMLASTVLVLPPLARAETPIRFTDVTDSTGVDFVHTIGDDKMSNIVESSAVGCALLDYDGDGWLDIYLVNGVHLPGLSDEQVPDRTKLLHASDRLYRGRGDGTFEDVTSKAGILPGGYGMGVAVGDYDNDGDPDLYVTNYGRNLLYRNGGNQTFEEVGQAAGVADERFGVGAVFFDYDGDGDLDLYLGNYLEYDPKRGVASATHGFPPPTAYKGQPNCLYRNEGNGSFTDVTKGSGTEGLFGRTMGVGVFDYDDDGKPDLFVANDAMENHLLQNLGDGKFAEAALLCGLAYGASGETTGAMSAEIGDVDGDGRMDMFVPDFTYTCLYLNQGEGFFVDDARRAGISLVCGRYVSWGAVLADFDLDTDLDLYIANGDAYHLKGHQDLLMVNDGHGQFRDISAECGPWFHKQRVGRGVASGDIDNDGDLDLLVAHLNDRPALLRNDSARDDRHWLMVKLQGRTGQSNRDAFGSRIFCRIRAADGTLRTLVRRYYSAGSYMCVHDARAHFGLGQATTIPEIEIRWPNGAIQKLKDLKVDQVLTVQQPAP